MLKPTDLKSEKYILIDSFIYEVINYNHKKIARGGAIVKAKLKSLESGEIIEKTFRGQEKIESAKLNFVKCQFLYNSNEQYFFMNSKDFSQFSLSDKIVALNKNFLKEGEEVDVIFSGNKAIGLHLPIKISFEVIESQPGVKGDTQSSANKEVVIETGFKLQAPLFIKKGNRIIVDTRDGKYVERAK